MISCPNPQKQWDDLNTRFWDSLCRALPAETKVGSGKFQRKNETWVYWYSVLSWHFSMHFSKNVSSHLADTTFPNKLQLQCIISSRWDDADRRSGLGLRRSKHMHTTISPYCRILLSPYGRIRFRICPLASARRVELGLARHFSTSGG